MTEPLFLVFDCETLDEAPPAGLIELGWTSVQRITDFNLHSRWEYGKLEGDMLFGIPEGQEMTPFNRSIHHIDPALLKGIPPFDPTEFGQHLDDVDYVVAHSASFEQQWLTSIDLPWICTMKCAIHAWPDAKHSNQALKYFLGMDDHEGLYPPHRALPDARVTAHTLARLLDLYPVEQLVEWTQQPKRVDRLPFGKHKGQLIAEAPGDYLEWVAGPKCEAAEEALKFACSQELTRRRTTQ
jgi:DNA polymerase III epsilon subunit-like protein